MECFIHSCQVIRYLFFALKEAFGLTPAALVWLR